jgi:ribosomal protein L29
MKKKELTELRSKELGELIKLIKDKKEKLTKLTPEIAIGKEKNLKKAAILRKEIAQILTIVKEKEMADKEIKAKE